MAMHPDEIEVDERVAHRLIESQFPEWAGQSVRRVAAAGTVNAVFRVGEHIAARFPLRGSNAEAARHQLEQEASAMCALADVCPFPTPQSVAIGGPGEGYPLSWSIQTWIPGMAGTPRAAENSDAFAADLVTLIRALRAADTNGRRFAGSGRGGNLADSDDWIKVCLRESEALLPVGRLAELWSRFRLLPRLGPDVMSHGDLIPANLLIEDERLVGVLDGGGFAPADPALDVVSAWHLLGTESRALLRRELRSSDLEWQRAAAWAFQQAMGLVWYYQHTNPAMSELGRITLSRILDAASPARRSSSVIVP